MSENTEREETYKTKMCKSVEEGRKCINGDSCRFAHDIKQLSIKDCIFASRCTFVNSDTINGNIVYTNNNTKQKLCQFLHPGETIENYVSRMTHTKPSLLRNQSTPVSSRPMSKCKATENGSWSKIVRKPISHPSLNIIELSENTEESTETEETEEIVVKVPKDAVEQALKAVLESGKTNVRIELVE